MHSVVPAYAWSRAWRNAGRNTEGPETMNSKSTTAAITLVALALSGTALADRDRGHDFFLLRQRSDIRDLRDYLSGRSTSLSRELEYVTGEEFEHFIGDAIGTGTDGQGHDLRMP